MSSRPHPLASAIAWAGRIASGVTTQWVDCRPEERQRIYYANHTSHLDAVVLWSALPGHIRRYIRPIAAADYWTATPTRRYLASRVFRAVLVDRHEHGAQLPEGERMSRARTVIQRIAAEMGENNSLIVFPEGTRGTGEQVANFKSGLYYLSRERPDVELVPVYLENLNRVLPKGEFLMVPVLCSVTFGPPVRVQDGEAKHDFLARAHKALCDLRRN